MDYPALTNMGIQNPLQIARYSLHEVDHVDHLRITYNREKGSLLPESRKYKFPQTRKTVLVNSGTRETQTVFESSSVLNQAVSELEDIVAQRKSEKEITKTLMDELQNLEEEMSERVASLRALVKSLQ